MNIKGNISTLQFILYDRPLLAISICYLFGIAIEYYGSYISPFLLISISLPISILTFLKRKASLFFYIILPFLIGAILFYREEPLLKKLPITHIAHTVEHGPTGPLIVRGTILSPVVKGGKTDRVIIKTRKVYMNGKWEVKTGSLYLSFPCSNRIFYPGDQVEFVSKLKPVIGFKNNGVFNIEEYLHRKKIWAKAWIGNPQKIRRLKRTQNYLYRLSEDIREKLRRYISLRFTKKEEACLLKALIVGDSKEIPRGMRDMFQKIGLSHILAISGLHIGLIFTMVFFTSRWLLSLSERIILSINIFKLSFLISLLFSIFYLYVSGTPISAIRASLILLFFAIGIFLNRETDLINLLSGVALTILIYHPNAIFQLSFQLSFLAIFFIFMFILKYKELAYSLSKAPRYLLLSLIASLGAVLGTAPIVATHFHRISWIGIFLNIIFIPFFGIIFMPLLIIMSIFSLISFSLADIVAYIFHPILKQFLFTLKYISNIPGISFWSFELNSFEIFLYYTILLSFLLAQYIPKAKYIFTILLLFLSMDTGYWIRERYFHPNLTINFIDVGQGSSILIEFPGDKTMLIDGGGIWNLDYDIGRHVIAPYLWHKKITQIDILVLTHPNRDHWGGLPFVANLFHPGEFWTTGGISNNNRFINMIYMLARKDTKFVLPPMIPFQYEINGVKITWLYPLEKDIYRFKAQNERSIILSLKYRYHRILLTSDISYKIERYLIRNSRIQDYDILLCPHHGSKYATSWNFLKKIDPKIAIISCGRFNPFGHPHRSVLNRIKRLGIKLLRTDLSGNISIELGKDSIQAETFAGNFLTIDQPVGK